MSFAAAVKSGSDTDAVSWLAFHQQGGYAIMPREVLFLIFERLKIEDVVACKAVCRSWRLAGSDERLWARLIKILPKNGIQVVKKENPTLSSYQKVVRYFETCVKGATNAMQARSPFLYRNECRAQSYSDLTTRHRDIFIGPGFASIDPKDIVIDKINGQLEPDCSKFKREIRYHEIAIRGREGFSGAHRNMLIFQKDVQAVLNDPVVSLVKKNEAVEKALETLVVPDSVTLTGWTRQERYTYILFTLMKSYAEEHLYSSEPESKAFLLGKQYLLQIVEALLIRDANPNVDANDFLFFEPLKTTTFNMKCSTPFQMAIALDWPEAIELFLTYNADPNKVTTERLFPIDIAFFQEHCQTILTLLIRHGADTKKHVDDAIQKKSTRILQALVDAGAEITGSVLE